MQERTLPPIGRPYQLKVLPNGEQRGARYFDSLEKVWAAYDALKPILKPLAEVRVRVYVLVDREGRVRLDP